MLTCLFYATGTTTGTKANWHHLDGTLSISHQPIDLQVKYSMIEMIKNTEEIEQSNISNCLETKGQADTQLGGWHKQNTRTKMHRKPCVNLTIKESRSS
jgi:hypothetical protein